MTQTLDPNLTSQLAVKDELGNVIERPSKLTNAIGVANRTVVTTSEGQIQVDVADDLSIHNVTLTQNATVGGNVSTTGTVSANLLTTTTGIKQGNYTLSLTVPA